MSLQGFRIPFRREKNLGQYLPPKFLSAGPKSTPSNKFYDIKKFRCDHFCHLHNSSVLQYQRFSCKYIFVGYAIQCILKQQLSCKILLEFNQRSNG